ncbi:MAG TPA: hypothetical protein VGQ59_10930 [Cyclobacteriaceae bacterium]|jgi:hypothetical protein|nr:hypothetical protein [Cyclobacteriaceae bacterium]
MEKIFTLVFFALTVLGVSAQETKQQVMEKRAKELHRVISLSDKDAWRKFIKENYTQALIDKPMRSQVSKSNDGETTSDKKEIGNNLEGKVAMFERLHNDFGGTKISSIKMNGDELEMQLSGDGLSGSFNLKFTTTQPYLIDGVGVRAQAGGLR